MVVTQPVAWREKASDPSWVALSPQTYLYLRKEDGLQP